MGWKGTEGNWLLYSGFPGGDITHYTRIEAKLSDFSENADFIRLRIKDKDGDYADYNLIEGANLIDLTTHATDFPNCDFANIDDITIWGSNSPKAGEVIDSDHPASVIIEEMSMSGMDEEYTAGEVLSLVTILNEETLVTIGGTDQTILYGTPTDNQIYSAAINTAMGKVSAAGNNSTYRFRIETASDEGLVLPSGVTTLYRIKAFKGDGTTPYTGPGWNGSNSFYLNEIGWTRNLVAQGAEGEDGPFWGITPIEGKTNTYKISAYKKDGTLRAEKLFGKSEWVFYVLEKNYVPEKKVVAANDQIFAMSNFSEGKWTFAEPVSLYDWDYLVIGTENTAANATHTIKMTDSGNKTIGGEDYNGGAVGTGAGMYLDYWNSQNIIAIDLNQLRINNGLDIFHIAELEITGDITPSVVYLTDYANPKLTNRGRWDLYISGDVVRTYSASETGKYGTICLPYVASYAGCEVYSIVNKSSDGIVLEKVTGLLEAGKPYFYISSDINGQDNGNDGKNVHNVNFFRADLEKYDAAKAGENNGLIGTFANDTKVPLGNFILYSNKTYCVDNDFYVDANRAYIDKSKITDKTAASSRTILLPFDGAEDNEATAIESTEAVEVLNEGVFYDMSGREVKNPTTGVYIVKYGDMTKKVMIK